MENCAGHVRKGNSKNISGIIVVIVVILTNTVIHWQALSVCHVHIILYQAQARILFKIVTAIRVMHTRVVFVSCALLENTLLITWVSIYTQERKNALSVLQILEHPSLSFHGEVPQNVSRVKSVIMVYMLWEHVIRMVITLVRNVLTLEVPLLLVGTI
jgi:hypothetical protein